MTESNKGRFKVADEAEAAWELFVKQVYAFPELIEWFKKDIDNSHFDWLANNLHEARLIHGSIYDEHGRIEDKDVAHEVYLLAHHEYVKLRPYMQQQRDYDINDLFRFGFDKRAAHVIFSGGKRKGTIFY